MTSDCCAGARPGARSDEPATCLVTNVERFATHDGPGIRTTVFLKGCPLRCPWCANPETQSLAPTLFRDPARCVGCRACEAACPSGAVGWEDGSFSHDATRCTSCRACERACLERALALQGRRRTVVDVMDEVMRDWDYYENSEGGGVTLSGGEPLMDRRQALALLREAKGRGLNVAVETTGNVAHETLEAAWPFVDHFLYDLKHLDDAVLREVVGSSGELVRANLTWLLARDAERVNVRIPVIPGFNYEPETLRAMLRWLADTDCRKVNLLPYHTLARPKAEKMGRTWWSEAAGLSEADLAPYHEYALALGMESKIGA